jgi:YD repeat-containing protein
MTPDESAIKKNRIKKISACCFTNADYEMIVTWEYDTAGTLMYDSNTESQTRYVYESGRLKYTYGSSGTHPGISIDTVFFQYDISGRLLTKKVYVYSQVVNGNDILDAWIKENYEYITNNVVVRKRERNSKTNGRFNNDAEIFYDTLKYNERKLLMYETENQWGRKTHYRYNGRGQLTEKLLTIKQWSHLSTFQYKNRLFIQEDLCGYLEKGICANAVTWHYQYDDRGLIKTISSNHSTLNYHYEYY